MRRAGSRGPAAAQGADAPFVLTDVQVVEPAFDSDMQISWVAPVDPTSWTVQILSEDLEVVLFEATGLSSELREFSEGTVCPSPGANVFARVIALSGAVTVASADSIAHFCLLV